MAEIFEYRQYSEQEILDTVKRTGPYNTGGLATNRPPFSEALAGTKLALRFDNGQTLDYEFTGTHELVWSSNNEPQSHPEYYEALEVDAGVILLVHICAGSAPQQAFISSIDFNERLVTTFFSKIGNAFSTREVDREITFGYVDVAGEAPPQRRHHLTTELVGRSIIWTYRDTFSIQHIYATPCYSAFADFNTFYGGTALTSPCDYVKLNDHIYIYSWVEIEGAGVQGFALMNLYDMHDVGCFFGINGSELFECYTFGAKGTYAGQLSNFTIPNVYAEQFGTK